MRRLLIASIPAILAIGALGNQWSSHELNQPLNLSNNDARLEAMPGDGLIKLLDRLEAMGAIRSSFGARLALRLRGLDIRIRLGEYSMIEGERLIDLLNRLQRGEVILYPVTIPEGVTVRWMLNHLSSLDFLTTVISGVNDSRLAPYRSKAGYLEGRFLPETYFVAKNESDLSVMKRAYEAMQETVLDAWSSCKSSDLLPDIDAVLTLASIVERETGVPRERAQIAGVFIRRLASGMKLQTDPTIIYGLGDSFDGDLRRSHLNDKTNPYNTYQIKGLPPSPIALPGAQAIAAVCNPEAGDSLYFVAKGDGSHAFSRTLSEHNQNVRRYQFKRRSDYRSTPTP